MRTEVHHTALHMQDPLPPDRHDYIRQAQLGEVDNRLRVLEPFEKELRLEKKLLYRRKLRIAPGTVQYLKSVF